MKKALKVIAILLVSAALIAALGFVTLAYLDVTGTGNPIIKMRAANEIKDYLNANYPSVNFEDFEVYYNFKTDVYGASVKSIDSKDTKFYVTYDEGEISDNYNDKVLGGINTYERVTDEMDDEVTHLIVNKYGGDIELCLFELYNSSLNDEPITLLLSHVALDETMDVTELKDIGIEPSLTLWFMTEDISYNYMGKRLIELQNLLNENGIYPVEYSISLRLPPTYEDRLKDSLNIRNFPAHLIGGDEFVSDLVDYTDE